MDPERNHARDRPPGPRRVASVREVTLPSRAQLWKSLATLQVYVDSLAMVVLMMRQSLFSGAVALAANLVFTQGMFWLGQATDRQSYTEFLVATMVNVSLVIALAMLLGHSAPLAKFHHTSRPDAQRSPLFWFWLVFRGSSVHCVVSTVLVALIAYAFTFTNPAWHSYQLQFYAGALVINYCTAAIDISARAVFQSQTVEGLALGHVNRSPLWKRLVAAYRKDFGFVIAVFIASAYIHISSQLQLDSQHGLIVFSLASMAFRIATMKITRSFILRLKKVHVRVLYVLATVPTVLINTQVRVALLRVQANVSMTGVVVLALIEPVMRFFKVWAVRQEILRKTSPSLRKPSARLLFTPLCTERHSPPPRRSRAPATNAIAVLPSPATEAVKPAAGPAPPVVVGSHSWAQRLLQFTAAEIHADMCSEYIAIACSMSIYYCLEGNAKFVWNADEAQGGSGSGGAETTRASRVELVLVQLLAEVAVDFGCCVWEQVNGIPLRTAPGLNGFLAVIFTGCAVTNIALCCSFYLRPV